MSLNLPKGHLSKSQIEMYLRCPMQYEWRYIRGIKEPPGVALIQGISAHEALAMNNQHKMVQHEDLPTKRVLEKFDDDFDVRALEVDRWDEPRDKVITQSHGLINQYMNSEAPLIQPVGAEKRAEVVFEYHNCEPIKVVGIIDILEESGLGDYKVTGRKKSKTEMEGDIGFGLYSAMVGIRNCYFMLLLKQAEARTHKQPICVEDKQIAWTKHVTMMVARSISAGIFNPCSPQSPMCSQKYCGYWGRCRGSKQTI